MNQPLAAIRTSAETALRWLTQEPPDVEAARKSIQRAIGNSYRAANVIRSFREMIGESASGAASFDINQIIADLLDLLSLDLRRHRIAVETALTGDLGPLSGDRPQIERVVANLITNAIDAMSGIHDRPRQLRIRSERDENGDALISVEDSGKGLEPAHRDRIFEPFFTTKPDGMGLGLALCRSIVEAHDGRLWAAPNLPHGSVFRFILPNRAR